LGIVQEEMNSLRVQMRYQKITIIFLGLMIAVATAAQSGDSHSILSTILVQDNCPLKILQATPTVSASLSHQKVRNQTLHRIDSFRVGWIVQFADNRFQTAAGNVVKVNGLHPGEVAEVPPQIAVLDKGVRGILFFIAEAHWEGGGVWKDDIDTLKSGVMQSRKSKSAGYIFQPGDGPGQ
jgi:hypothetical protein